MTDSQGEIFVQFTWQNLLARCGWLCRRRFWRRFRALGFCRCERRHKRLFEIVDIFEIFDRILLGLSENTGGDQIKNHVSDVFAGMDAPAIEHCHHHRAEFLERVLPDSVEQFRPGHVTHADALDFLLLLGREVERIAQKNVAIPLVVGIVGYNRLESLGESNLLHRQKRRVSNALPKIIGNRKRATAESLSAANKQTSGSRNGSLLLLVIGKYACSTTKRRTATRRKCAPPEANFRT